ncbi:MAG TPA: DinB family protein [Pyrinomonadaceae bacterium]|nr:DinB family protein [Pyrinomonadaceae bacterium]
MVKRLRWLEREFDFAHLSVGMLPYLIERLRGAPTRLEEKLRPLPPETLTARAGGGWSVQEHAGHLADLDELHEARLEDYRAGLPSLRPADMTNRKTVEAGHNDAPLEQILAAFRSAREGFVRRLESMSEEEAAASALHPRLARQMRVFDLAYFVAEHDDHHLAIISELLRDSAQ